jgi:hypothetical protein
MPEKINPECSKLSHILVKLLDFKLEDKNPQDLQAKRTNNSYQQTVSSIRV